MYILIIRIKPSLKITFPKIGLLSNVKISNNRFPSSGDEF